MAMNKVSTFALLSCFVASSALGATVSRIDVSGNQRMDAESIRILADVKVGDNVGDARSNEIAKKLQESGYFSKISVNMSGNVLKIALTESPIINMVTVEGNDEVSTDDLKKEIRTKERTSYDASTITSSNSSLYTIFLFLSILKYSLIVDLVPSFKLIIVLAYSSVNIYSFLLSITTLLKSYVYTKGTT